MTEVDLVAEIDKQIEARENELVSLKEARRLIKAGLNGKPPSEVKPAPKPTGSPRPGTRPGARGRTRVKREIRYREIMDCMRKLGRPVDVRDIAENSDVPRTTAFNFLHRMAEDPKVPVKQLERRSERGMELYELKPTTIRPGEPVTA